jgi:hypothetical protein
MNMFDQSNLLITIKDLITNIIPEIVVISYIKIINIFNLSSYLHYMKSLQKSIICIYNRFDKISNPNQLFVLDILYNNLNEFYNKIKEFNSLQKIAPEIENEIILIYDKIKLNIDIINQIEKDLYGIVYYIDNIFMKNIWLRSNTPHNYIEGSILFKTIYNMLKYEEINIINEDYCKYMIEKFIKKIDTLKEISNDIITVEKINYYQYNDHNIKTLIELDMNIYLYQDKNKYNKYIQIYYKKPYTISCCTKKKINDSPYFTNNKVCEFTIPYPTIIGLTLSNISIEIDANDQNIGMTGQCYMGYQINNNNINIGFYIRRDIYKDNKYRFKIFSDKIKIGDIITFWLFCPLYNGWKATINNICVYAKFI